MLNVVEQCSDVVLVFLLLTLNRFETDVSIVDFEQVNAG